MAKNVPNEIGDCVLAKRFVVALMEMIPLQENAMRMYIVTICWR